MPAQALTRDDMDRIHRLLSEDITALETERFNAMDAPETRREKETELEAARATRQRVEAAMALQAASARLCEALRDRMRLHGEALAESVLRPLAEVEAAIKEARP